MSQPNKDVSQRHEVDMITLGNSLPTLESLAAVGSLLRERAEPDEVTALVRSACLRLGDARIDSLSEQSRFDLGHNAAHLLAHAALRWHGYRSTDTYLAFHCLAETLGVDTWISSLLSLCHDRWLGLACEGLVDADVPLVDEMLKAAELLLQRVLALDEIVQEGS